MRWPWIGVLAIALGTGCQRPAPPPLPPIATALPSSGSESPAFQKLTDAATTAETEAGKLATRTSFLPSQRSTLSTKLAGSVANAVSATESGVEFAYTPRRPFDPVPYQTGWRMIGRVMRWNLDSAIEAGDYDRAVTIALQAIRFGLVLTRGGATDASLGFVIVEDARKALIGSLNEMSPETLDRLATGLEKALTTKPPITEAIDHEGASSLLAIQYLQDEYAARRTRGVLERLGPSVKDAVEYLEGLGSEAAPAYFQAFADDARRSTDILKSRAALPVVRRAEVADLYPKKKRKPPFWRFARHFVGVAEPLLAINDRVETRFRLMAITCRMTAIRKRSGSVPRTLKDVDSMLKLDPFTGNELRFQSDGQDFRVYSVGLDGRDDGGDTDDAFTSPDLTLEG